MHSVFTRPWKWGTSLIVILVVLVTYVALFWWVYKGEFTVSWAGILGTIGVALPLGADELVKRWKPAWLLIGIILVAILLAVSLLLEPQGKFTLDSRMPVCSALAFMFWYSSRRSLVSDEARQEQ